MSVVTWDQSCKGEIIALNEDQLTITATKSEPDRGKHFIRATKGVSSGKWYWELSIVQQSALAVGFTTSNKQNGLNILGTTGQAITVRLFAGFPIYTFGYFMEFQDIEKKIIENGVCHVGVPEIYPGLGTYGFALDLDNKEFYLYKDGKKVVSMKSSYLARDNLKLYPALFVDSYYGGGYATANFGATPFVYTIPEGYTSFDENQGRIKKYLLKNDEGYKNLTELVSTTFPTDQQFKEKGMNAIPAYSQLSNFNDLITYTTDNLSKSLVKFKPKDKIILSSGAINFSGKELKKVSLIGTENARVLFSKDRGVTWHGNVIRDKIPITSATSTSPTFEVYSPDKTIDGDKDQKTSSYWQVVSNYPEGQNGHRLILDLSVPTKISKTIITAGVQHYWAGSGVKDFEIFGCNEIGNETLLYSGTALNTTGSFVSTTTLINDDTPYCYLIYNIKNSYTGSNYVIVTEVEIFGITNTVPISDIPTQGLTPTQLSAITPEEWKSFMGDSSSLRFAYYLPDETASTDKLELTLDFTGKWVVADYGNNFRYSYPANDKMKVKLLSNGDYKINYEGGVR